MQDAASPSDVALHRYFGEAFENLWQRRTMGCERQILRR
jgi:hypothetical protein